MPRLSREWEEKAAAMGQAYVMQEHRRTEVKLAVHWGSAWPRMVGAARVSSVCSPELSVLLQAPN